MISETRAAEIFRGFSKIRVLVIGDVMVDRYIWGTVSRISPEAPVPVVHVNNESRMPGGAANVVNNLHSLGVSAGIIGVVGKDSTGSFLKSYFKKKNVSVRGILSARSRMTIEKTRIVAHSQQVVRVDRESSSPLTVAERKSLISSIRRILPQYDAIIIEDYGKGVIDQQTVDEILSVKKKKPSLIVSYDPKKGHVLHLKNIDMGTPNLSEAETLVDKRTEKFSPLPVEKVGADLRRLWGAQAVLVTLGEHGMALFEKGKNIFRIPTVAREVYDVSGAGDTVIATATACLSAGADAKEAAILSNYAAGVVVGKLGTQTVTRSEILSGLRLQEK
jgi:D-glycero-beta-D-manno-heptose-7-phosphate kinase